MDQFLFAAPFSALPTFAAALFGLLIGSFLNVVIHRMPKMLEREFENACAEHVGKEPVHTDTYTLSVPRSACPHCGHKITAPGKRARDQLPGLARQVPWLQGADFGALPGHRTAVGRDGCLDDLAVWQRLGRPWGRQSSV